MSTEGFLADDGAASPSSYLFDLFVIHAADDAAFVHGYLLPSLSLSRSRVLSIDELRLGEPIVSEIERGLSRSRFAVIVLSPAWLADRWAMFGGQLASYLSIDGASVIPLRLTDCDFPLHLKARVSLDFTKSTLWQSGVTRLRALLRSDTRQRPRPNLERRSLAEFSLEAEHVTQRFHVKQPEAPTQNADGQTQLFNAAKREANRKGERKALVALARVSCTAAGGPEVVLTGSGVTAQDAGAGAAPMDTATTMLRSVRIAPWHQNQHPLAQGALTEVSGMVAMVRIPTTTRVKAASARRPKPQQAHRRTATLALYATFVAFAAVASSVAIGYSGPMITSATPTLVVSARPETPTSSERSARAPIETVLPITDKH